MSEWQLLITVNTPFWTKEDKKWLTEMIYNTVKQEVPKTDFTVQEFSK